MNKTKKIALITAIIDSTIMGIGMIIMNLGMGYSYGEPEMVKVLVVVELVITLMILFVAKKYFGWKNVGFKKINFKDLRWFAPHIIVIVYGVTLWIMKLLSVASNLSSSQWSLILLVCVTTMLVGISEELMFRGIILHTFKSNGSVRKAIFVSAVCFSLLHSINILGGAPIINVAMQLVLTFIMGMCFASLAIKIQNLWPLIIFHWLWDFILVSAPIIGFVNLSFSSLGILLNLFLAVILWRNLRNFKKIDISNAGDKL